MLKVPVGSIRSIHMQLNADLEYLDGLLPVEVVVADKVADAPFEITKSVLMVIAVTASLLVEVPKLCQFPDIIAIRSVLRSYREI
jgi:hypothetical protein